MINQLPYEEKARIKKSALQAIQKTKNHSVTAQTKKHHKALLWQWKKLIDEEIAKKDINNFYFNEYHHWSTYFDRAEKNYNITKKSSMDSAVNLLRKNLIIDLHEIILECEKEAM